MRSAGSDPSAIDPKLRDGAFHPEIELPLTAITQSGRAGSRGACGGRQSDRPSSRRRSQQCAQPRSSCRVPVSLGRGAPSRRPLAA